VLEGEVEGDDAARPTCDETVVERVRLCAGKAVVREGRCTPLDVGEFASTRRSSVTLTVWWRWVVSMMRMRLRSMSKMIWTGKRR
jgi:hypothetical protein